MHSARTQLALAGSVLVLVAGGTITAMHLGPYPVSAGVATDVAAGLIGAQPPVLSSPGTVPPAAAPADRPAAPTRQVRSDADERPVFARDLIDPAGEPEANRTVTLPQHHLDWTAALRLVQRVVGAELPHPRAHGRPIGPLGTVVREGAVRDPLGSGRHARAGHQHRATAAPDVLGMLDGLTGHRTAATDPERRTWVRGGRPAGR